MTQAEKAYIAQHPVIRASNENDFAPFDYAVGGKAYGYSIDVLNLAAERAGLKVKYVNGYTWSELLDLFKAGELDLIHTLTRTAAREKFGLFSQPYFHFKFHFIIRDGDEEVRYPDDLAGKVMVLGRGWSQVPYLEKYYPDIILHYVDTYEEMLEAVANGVADVTISAVESFRYTSSRLNINNLKVSGWFKEFDRGKSRKYHFMVQKAAPALKSILDKALLSLTPQDFAKLNDKWFASSEYYEQGIILSAAEQVYLEHNPNPVFGIGRSFAPLVIKQPNGLYTGFAPELFKILSRRIGVDLALDVGNWAELQEKAKRDEIHGLAVATDAKIFEPDFVASEPLMQRASYIYVKRGNPLKIRDAADLKRLRVAVQRKNAMSMQIARELAGDTMKLILVDSVPDMVEAVISGKADYTIHGEAVSIVAERLGMRSMIEVAFVHEKPFHMVIQVRNTQPELVSILNKALMSLSVEERHALRRRWFQMKNGFTGEPLILTGAEREYLTMKGGLKICGVPKWLPFEAQDNGRHLGMASDYMRLFSDRIGIGIELVPTESWVESLQNVREGNCDALSLAKFTPERAAYLDFTTPYLSYPNVIVVKNSENDIQSLDDVLNRSIAVVRGFAVISDLRRRDPKVKLLEVDSVHQGLRAVREGRAAAYVGLSSVIAYNLNQGRITDLKIAGRLPWGYKLSVATRNDEPLLRGIFEKAVDSISPQEHKRIQHKWMALDVQRVTDYSLLLLVLGGATLVIVAVIVWNRQLQTARQRTEQALRDLSEARQLLEQQNRDLENLSVTDRLTQLFNRTKLDEVLTAEVLRATRQETDFAVMMLDLDHFKAVNDNYGHKTGDLVLVELADLLSSGVRMTDVVGRWGGEEFMVLCIGADLDGCTALAEKLRHLVEQHDFPVVHRLTASFGVSMYHEGDNVDRLVDRADKALYEAKRQGRNRVCLEKSDEA